MDYHLWPPPHCEQQYSRSNLRRIRVFLRELENSVDCGCEYYGFGYCLWRRTGSSYIWFSVLETAGSVGAVFGHRGEYGEISW